MTQPLSISLPTSTAQTTVPVIAEGPFVRWRFVSLQENKNDVGPFLTLTCKLDAPTVTTEGTPLKPGDPVGDTYWHKIYLYEKEKGPDGKPVQPERAKLNADGSVVVPDRAILAISTFIDAVLNTCDASRADLIAKGKSPRPDFNDATVMAMTNQPFYAKMKVKKDDFGVRNEFGTLMSVADMPKAT